MTPTLRLDPAAVVPRAVRPPHGESRAHVLARGEDFTRTVRRELAATAPESSDVRRVHEEERPRDTATERLRPDGLAESGAHSVERRPRPGEHDRRTQSVGRRTERSAAEATAAQAAAPRTEGTASAPETTAAADASVVATDTSVVATEATAPAAGAGQLQPVPAPTAQTAEAVDAPAPPAPLALGATTPTGRADVPETSPGAVAPPVGAAGDAPGGTPTTGSVADRATPASSTGATGAAGAAGATSQGEPEPGRGDPATAVAPGAAQSPTGAGAPSHHDSVPPAATAAAPAPPTTPGAPPPTTTPASPASGGGTQDGSGSPHRGTAGPVVTMADGSPVAAPVNGAAPAPVPAGGASDTGTAVGGSPAGGPATGTPTAGSTGTPALATAGSHGSGAAALPTGQASPSAPAAPAGAPAPPAPVPTPPAQLFPHVVALATGGRGVHRMVVQLSPESLGPVELQVEVSRDGVTVRLSGAHEATREILRQGLPDLRRDLAEGGFGGAGVSVSDDAPGGAPRERQAPETGPDRTAPERRAAEEAERRLATTLARLGGDPPGNAARRLDLLA